jgi:hypothetical protein
MLLFSISCSPILTVIMGTGHEREGEKENKMGMVPNRAMNGVVRGNHLEASTQV